jgi:hypothetical protein
MMDTLFYKQAELLPILAKHEVLALKGGTGNQFLCPGLL